MAHKKKATPKKTEAERKKAIRAQSKRSLASGGGNANPDPSVYKPPPRGGEDNFKGFLDRVRGKTDRSKGSDRARSNRLEKAKKSGIDTKGVAGKRKKAKSKAKKKAKRK